jgi:hypoxanthine phosphoribosyltransferase
MSLRTTQVFIPREQIHTAVQRLAAAIQQDYATTPLMLIASLKGAFIFLADLIRVLDLPMQIAFLRLASYGSGTVSSGRVQIVQPLTEDIAAQHLIIVEDIVDSGYTITFLQQYLWQQQPASVRLCTLLDKPARRQVPVTIDYCGFTIPDVFVVGYGLDWNEQYRQLPDLCILASPDAPVPHHALSWSV